MVQYIRCKEVVIKARCVSVDNSLEMITLDDMKQKRSVYGFSLLNDKLYVFGGCASGQSQHLSSIEVFNEQMQEWQTVSSVMASRRRHPKAIGKFYYNVCKSISNCVY